MWLGHMSNSLHSAAYARLVAVLVAARLESGLTQQTVANRLGKPQSYVAKIEGGERRLDVVEFIALAGAIGLDPKMLFKHALQAVQE